MHVQSTADIPLPVLRKFRDELGPGLAVDIEESQFFFKSLEPPSWISLIADSQWWIKALAGAAAIYVGGILAEAGKDTWRNRGRAASAATGAANVMMSLARNIMKLKSQVPERTRFEVGLSVPGADCTAKLQLLSADADDLAMEIALFVHHAPSLIALMEKEQLYENRPAGGIFATLEDDNSLRVQWLDGEKLEKVERVLPFRLRQ